MLRLRSFIIVAALSSSCLSANVHRCVGTGRSSGASGAKSTTNLEVLPDAVIGMPCRWNTSCAQPSHHHIAALVLPSGCTVAPPRLRHVRHERHRGRGQAPTCSVVIRCGSRLSKPTTLSIAATRLSEGNACRCFTTDTSSRAEYLVVGRHAIGSRKHTVGVRLRPTTPKRVPPPNPNARVRQQAFVHQARQPLPRLSQSLQHVVRHVWCVGAQQRQL